MDAIFMSPHKFIGGPGCSGLLVAKRSIFKSTKSPTFPGGGTVSFVSPSCQDYDDSIEAREDAGTPAIVQAIRTGLVFQVKEMVGCQRIESIERHYCRMAFSKLRGTTRSSLLEAIVGHTLILTGESPSCPSISDLISEPTRRHRECEVPCQIQE